MATDLNTHVRTHRAMLDTLEEILTALSTVPGAQLAGAIAALSDCRELVEELEDEQSIIDR